MWEQRAGERLTFAGYVAVGGIAGAIGTLAEAVWSELTADEQSVARVLLLRLAGPGDGAGVVRRRVPLVEIEALTLPGPRQVLARLAHARLLTIGEAHVEVAHEVLFREWPRLRGWLSDDAAGRAVQRRLALAASEWASEGREPGALWRGARLLSGLEVAGSRPEEVTLVERAFLEAGREAAEAEERAVLERAAATARQNRRLRGLLVGAAVLLAVALVAGLLAMRARGEAEDSATRAEASAVSAEARRLAANALNEDQPSLALLQAVEATQREQSPETYGALLTLLTRSPDIVTRFRVADRLPRIGASADGALVYLAENSERLYAVDAVTGEQQWTATTRGGLTQWGTAAVDPRGDWLAVPLIGDPESTAMAVVDPQTGKIMREITVEDLTDVEPEAVPWVDESAHRFGRKVVLTTESHAFVIDPDTGAVLRAMPFGRHERKSWSLRDNRIAAQTYGQKLTRVLDLRTGRQRFLPGLVVGVDQAGTRIITSRVSPDGGDSSHLQLRDAQWRSIGQAQRVDGQVVEVAFLPGGREVAVAREEVVDIHDAATLTYSRTLEGHSGEVLGIELAGPGRGLLWTAGQDGTAVAFDLTGTRGVLRTVDMDVAAGVGTAAGDRAVVTPWYEAALNTARILDLEKGRDLFGELQPFTDCVCQVGHTAITPDGRLALAGIFEWTDDYATAINDRGRVVAWDTDTGELIRTIHTPWEPFGLAVTPGGDRLLVNGTGGWALYDLASGEELWRHETGLRGQWIGGLPMAGAAPDGSLLVVLRGETVILLDPASGEEEVSEELTGSGGTLTRVAFSADSRTLAVGSQGGRLYFLDVATLERVAPDRRLTAGIVVDLQASPDSSMLAAMGADGDVTLFDPTTWRPFGKPVVDGLGSGFLSFTEDSLRMYGETGPDYELSTNPAEWVAAGCRIANTDFTAEESAVILPGEPVEPTCR